MIDVQKIKQDFPILKQMENGKPLVFLDSASTSQKPQVVLDALQNYYLTMNANIHRGVYGLSEKATEAYEGVREQVKKFLHADQLSDEREGEVIFTRNTTESLNFVAYCYGEMVVENGDEVVVSALEHHSNLVPWQELCKRKGATLKVIPIADDGTLVLEGLEEIITEKCKILAVSQMSNVLGTILPLEVLIGRAREVGASVVVDAAQGIAHQGFDLRKIDVDFVAFSAHKMMGPTGVGVLWGKKKFLEQMPPFLFGGDMVREVSDFSATFQDAPAKYEAGTPNIADVIAFGAAISYLENIGFEKILDHDQKLVTYGRKRLSEFHGLQLFGTNEVQNSGGIVSFTIPGVHPHDIGSILNEFGVCIRTGHHCAQPLMKRLGVNATARMSFYVYNDESDIDRACEGIKKVYEVFKV